MSDYQVLMVEETHEAVRATHPGTRIVGAEENTPYRDDCRRIAATASKNVILDLRRIEFGDGTFFRNILELERTLSDKSLELTVVLHPDFAAAAKIVGLDRLVHDDLQ